MRNRFGNNDECPICLVPFNDHVVVSGSCIFDRENLKTNLSVVENNFDNPDKDLCHHKYHCTCINEWHLKNKENNKKTQCPLCIRDIKIEGLGNPSKRRRGKTILEALEEQDRERERRQRQRTSFGKNKLLSKIKMLDKFELYLSNKI
jgi:hypothetical protein